jgi:Lon protease-like protein
MEIPLFPLPNLVLFPSVAVPLHIFEDRYKLMINGSIDKDEPFGLVCLRSGALEESETTIHRVGVTARVVQVDRLDDGRMNVLCHGETRFRVYRFIQQVPYWKASVDFFDDDHESPASLRQLHGEAAALYRKALELGARLGSEEPDAETVPELPESPAELSFMLSYVLDTEPEEKQRLLEMTSTAERLRMLVTAVQATIRKLEQQLTYKEKIHKVRGNGDLGRPGASSRE